MSKCFSQYCIKNFIVNQGGDYLRNYRNVGAWALASANGGQLVATTLLFGGRVGKSLREGSATFRFGPRLLFAFYFFRFAAIHLATLLLAKRTVPVVEIAIVGAAFVENITRELGVAFAKCTFAVARLVL